EEETGAEQAGPKTAALAESFTLAFTAKGSKQRSKAAGQKSATRQERSEGSAAATTAAAITEQRRQGQRPKVREESEFAQPDAHTQSRTFSGPVGEPKSLAWRRKAE